MTQPFTAVEVGRPYSLTRSRWPEGVDYNYRAEQHELRLFFDSPRPSEIKDITKNPARFALAVSGDVIFFCYKFGALPWSDATYSIHLVPADQQTLPPVTGPDERALLTVILIDALTGKRPYRRASTSHEALEIMDRGAATNFDAAMLHCWRRHFRLEVAA